MITPDTLVIFAHSPAGFGHIRVTNSLKSGLPADILRRSLTLGTHDDFVIHFHRLTSVNWFGRLVFEWCEHDPQQILLARLLRFIVQRKTSALEKILIDYIQSQTGQVSRIVIVATHFEPAHKIGAVLKKLRQRFGLPIQLVVQVTDDTFLRYWLVMEADMIVLPSHTTAQKLHRYAGSLGKNQLPVRVLPYPLSTSMQNKTEADFKSERLDQLLQKYHVSIHVIVPISGAGIGLDFAEHLISKLHKIHPAFLFHVVVRTTDYTHDFIQHVRRLHYVRVYTHPDAVKVVELYEYVYHTHTICFEITKPSEQTFKCLLTPSERGGSILLFTHPVGKQEEDNVYFLERHNLIPSSAENEILHPSHRKSIPESTYWHLHQEARKWRGLKLPLGSHASAMYIQYCLLHGLFEQMLHYEVSKRNKHHPELRSDGVKKFWDEIALLNCSDA